MARLITDSTFDLAYIDKQLRAMRAWFDGYKGGGGEYPHDVDVLRKVQVLLKSSRPLKTSTEARDTAIAASKALHKAELSLMEVDAQVATLAEIVKEISSSIGFEGERVEPES